MPDPDPPVAGLPQLIAGPRVRLILVTPADAADMLAGRHQERWHRDYPRQDDLDAVSMMGRGEGWSASDPTATWGPRHLVADYAAIGSIGCFGPPEPADDGALEVEIGYGLVADLHRQGLGSEAVAALLAETDRLGVRARARTEPENTASLRLLARCGFTLLRGRDEEGLLELARPVPGGTAGASGG